MSQQSSSNTLLAKDLIKTAHRETGVLPEKGFMQFLIPRASANIVNTGTAKRATQFLSSPEW